MKGHRWFAATYDLVNRWGERRLLGPLRRRLLGNATGTVLELGAGTGVSFPYYPRAATIVATEPDPFMLRRARRHAAQLDLPVRFVRCTAEALPFAGATFDTVVVALVLCTVEDLPQSLAEARRVLKPDGTLRFIEHVRADGFAGEVQDALAPIWRRVAAGCHPNRRTAEQIEAAGFALEEVERRRLTAGVPLVTGVAAPYGGGDPT